MTERETLEHIRRNTSEMASYLRDIATVALGFALAGIIGLLVMSVLYFYGGN